MYPVLFYLYKLPISPYGVLLALALVIGVALSLWRARRVGMRDDVVLDTAFFGVLSGFAGGRAAYILTHWSEFTQRPLALIFDRAGFTFLGGLIVALAVCVWVIRRRGERPFRVGDVMTPSLALGHALGRVGCFFAGCCYGSVCPPEFAAWGVSYPLRHDATGAPLMPPALYDQIERQALPPDATRSLAVWPVQLMESAGLLLIFIALWLLWRRRRFDGQIVCVYLASYSCLRFALEFLRGDADRGIWAGLSTSQWLSIGCVASAGALWWRLRTIPLAPMSLEPVAAAGEAMRTGAPPDRPPGRSRRRHRRGGK